MKKWQEKESIVFTGTEWSTLRYGAIDPQSVTLRYVGFADLTNPVFAEVMFRGRQSATFEIGKDFELDAANGKIRRTPDSAIPDYRESHFYGVEEFTHEGWGGDWGNFPFITVIDYCYDAAQNQLVEDDARRITMMSNTPVPQKTLARLQKGETLTYVVYGDSISTGCEASMPEETYFARFADKLERVTGGHIHLINRAVGGERSREGINHVNNSLAQETPDLVTIAYGMNDMNPNNDMTPALYKENMRTMLNACRAVGADVIFVTPCPPNPRWKYTGKDWREYAAMLRELAKEENVPLADVQALWDQEMTYGKTISDLLYNDVNHPTSYGHYLYAAMLNTLIV
ncbi:MAG: SGNH/GDSL hydrolase family protein [Clostridia bacterium]|nr:SGNH/GDSL hydrolase family protein [Clostridia bacterium]